MKQILNLYMGLVLGTLIYAVAAGLEREETLGRVIILTMVFLPIWAVMGICRLFRKPTSP
jgi:hypothetical protein